MSDFITAEAFRLGTLAMRNEIESLRQQLADALDCKNGHGPTALEQYTQITKDEPEMVPIEQLRFFLSLGLNGQDWLDVEPFIEAVMQQLADSQKREVMLRDALEYHQAHTRPIQRTEEALAATPDPKDVILCHAEPVATVFRAYGGSGAVHLTGLEEGTPLYRAWEPK